MDETTLELYANQIEAVFLRHAISARVSGGVVKPRALQFVLAGVEDPTQITPLVDDLASALRSERIGVTRLLDGHVAIQIRRAGAPPVMLFALLSKFDRRYMPPCTATLGLCDDGAPLLIRLPAANVGHVLITGSEGCGKTSLLRTIAVSLAVFNRPRHVQLVMRGPGLSSLRGLPNVLDRTLHDLAALPARDAPLPRIVVLIDDLTTLDEDLAQLLQGGRAAGVHIVATSRESLAGFGTLIEAGDEPGVFVATMSDASLSFSAAYITPAEIHQVIVESMPLLEKTWALRSALAQLASAN
jgi:DNA segregation ATPase FtsK/SpoIIIE-like protein